jgi:hypothetical protein
MTGQNAGELPATLRRDAAHIAGNYAVDNPPVQSAKVPGNFSAIAGQLFGGFPPVIRSIIGTLRPLCRRTTAISAGLITGHFPIHFRAYA